MNRRLSILVSAACLAWAAAAPSAGARTPRHPPLPKPIVVAAETSFQNKKEAYLLDVQREVNLLTSETGRLSRIYSTDAGANRSFAEAKRVFDQKTAAVESKLAALRATPADSAQSAMGAVDAALKDLRDAYSQVLGAAK
jgi:hypothetical protein